MHSEDYNAPEHTVTSKQIVESVRFKCSNGPYGSLASKLCNALGKTTNSDKVYIFLATNFPKAKRVHRKLKLRPQIVQAIKKLNGNRVNIGLMYE